MKAWLPPVAWMGVLFFLSSRPVPPEAEVIPDWLTHGSAWMLLALLLARALEASGVGSALAWAFVIAVGYGVFDEIHQSWVPFRTPDPMDVVKDAIGALAGLAVWHGRLRRLFHPEVT